MSLYTLQYVQYIIHLLTIVYKYCILYLMFVYLCINVNRRVEEENAL